MAPVKHAASSAASARTSRAGSTARDILKKRNRPYKTEQQLVFAKKRKLHLHTAAYTQAIPRGYTFLPVGTPDLAERCKEISRQKDYAVNVVNAKPASKNAHDPSHVSHHIARIGYHFRSEVVDEAREQLGYIFYYGEFVKEAELEQQRRQAAQQSIIAKTLAKYGVSTDGLAQQSQRESPDKVRAAIKELFPKIPDLDLGEIVRHAWEEGSDRVGTRSEIELPRRVQLATIARIRHMYTDYDRLLRAFEWKQAREMVEPVCLQKLIEWRGESDIEDDNELEEIVRETIVIDDDDDAPPGHGGETDDDSVIEIGDGDTSDASIEIIHHRAADNDFGVESAVEESRRRPDRHRPQKDTQDLHRAMARQMIGAARERMRTGGLGEFPAPQGNQAQQPQYPWSNANSETRVNVEPDQNGHFPEEIVVDGRRMVLARPRNTSSTTASFSGGSSQQYVALARHDDRVYIETHATPPQSYPLPVSRRASDEMIDRPVASIERDHHATPSNGRHMLPTHPPPATPGKVLLPWQHREDQLLPGLDLQHRSSKRARDHVQPPTADVEVIDLLSPPRHGRGTARSPKVIDDSDGRCVDRRMPNPHGIAMHTRPQAISRTLGVAPSRHYLAEPQQLPYDQLHRHALLGDSQHQQEWPPEQYRPPVEATRYIQIHTGAPPPEGFAQMPSHGSEYAREPYGLTGGAPPSYPYPSRGVHQPVHGAPAFVQQAPIGAHPQAMPLGTAPYGGASAQYAIPNGEHDVTRQPPTHYYYPT
ncbi:hypothetical protein LTR53_017634 [Teratosphaeriaceae sp. CCFEE 6253]|nr:hypothetical protein LTR53_017634 [Teratosphaeriaceae sp. CCFEE 6253]